MISRFLDFAIDFELLELRKGSSVITLEPQVFKLLALLVDNRDRVVSKDELIAQVWDGRLTSDAAITSRINLLRKALGDSGAQQKVIRTLPKRGYRFVAEVTGDTGAEQATNVDLAAGVWSKPQPSNPTVVVLPFRGLGPSGEQDFLAEGLTEEISVALSRSSDITVIAHRSAKAAEEMAPLDSDAGRLLAAKFVIHGQVQRGADRIRVTARVIDSEAGEHLWADRFDGQADDIFELQDRVTQSIAAVLPVRIQANLLERHAWGRNRSSSGYEAYLSIISSLRRSGDVGNAIAALGELLKQDEKHALAHAQLAVLLGFYPFVIGQDDPAMVARAIAHARQALALNGADERVLAKAALAFSNAGDIKRALHFSEKALALNPYSVEAMNFRGCILYSAGEHESALDYQNTVMKLDPLFPQHYFETVIEANYLLGRYDAAIGIYENWDRPHRHMAITMSACHAMNGDLELAGELAEDFLATRPAGFRMGDYVSALMRYLAREQDREHWREGFSRAGLWRETSAS